MTTVLYLKPKTFLSFLKDSHFYPTGFGEGWFCGFKIVCPELTEKDVEEFIKEIIKELREEFHE